MDGKSVGITPRARWASPLIAPAASRIARSRFTGSAIWVFRFTRLSVACVVYSVLPASRSEIGMRRDQRLLRDAAMLRQVAAQRAAAQRQHDVVELGVVRRGQLLERVERQSTPQRSRARR